MRELIPLDDPRAARAPTHIRELAAARRAPETRILHVVWDEADGYPSHATGFEQWSVRPYQVGQGCDGTIECNMHLVALVLLSSFGLDYRRCYEEAYPDRSLGGWPNAADVIALSAETEVPQACAAALEALLHDLYDTNHRALEDLLRTRLEDRGHIPPGRSP